MSSIANWSYNSVGVIKPFLGHDMMTQENIYGEPYEIRCDFLGGPVMARSNDGEEFIGTYKVWTEDPRPKYLDWIVSVDEFPINCEVRSHAALPARSLGDPIPDYLMVTK